MPSWECLSGSVRRDYVKEFKKIKKQVSHEEKAVGGGFFFTPSMYFFSLSRLFPPSLCKLISPSLCQPSSVKITLWFQHGVQPSGTHLQIYYNIQYTNCVHISEYVEYDSLITHLVVFRAER